MGLLSDQLNDDAAGFVDADVFGEPVVYKPVTGGAFSVLAVVSRYRPDTIEETAAGLSPVIEISIRNHATLGRTSIDTGGDTVSVAARLGGPAEDHPVAEILDQDAGVWRLRLR